MCIQYAYSVISKHPWFGYQSLPKQFDGIFMKLMVTKFNISAMSSMILHVFALYNIHVN